MILEYLALILSALLFGSLAGGALLYTVQFRHVNNDALLHRWLPAWLRQNMLFGLAAGLMAALAGLSFEGFLLAIIAMSLFLSRVHLLRMAIDNLREGNAGDAGALRMYRVSLGLLAGLLLMQILGSLWVILLLANQFPQQAKAQIHVQFIT